MRTGSMVVTVVVVVSRRGSGSGGVRELTSRDVLAVVGVGRSRSERDSTRFPGGFERSGWRSSFLGSWFGWRRGWGGLETCKERRARKSQERVAGGERRGGKGWGG